ncbi:OmpA family protein [Gaopeijia maritima]|uniref:OmpA family protein n=1 Tax=Gaopeijia maritima TaxID=3119007 RepID=UPI003272BA97
MRAAPLLTVAAVVILALPSALEAQLGRLGDRIRRTVEDEVTQQVDDMVREAVRCALGDAACAERARQEGQTPVFEDADGNVVVDEDGQPITDPEDAVRAAEEPGTGVWRNYDFVPGSEVIYALDLTDEPVGRIPARQIEYVEGNMQVVERDGRKQLEFSSATTFYVPLPRELPEDFTVEFEFQAAAPNIGMTFMTGTFDGGNLGGYSHHYLDLWQNSGISRAREMISSQDGLWHIATELIPFKFQVDGSADAPDYAILYAGTDRVAQVPNADFARGPKLEVRIPANNDRRAYLANLVVAIHGDPLYDALSSTGEFTTRGILFDLDSDRIRPESTPTLQQILSTLEQHADLALTIEGHTDSSGEEDYNQALSERRAQAVVAWLAGQGVDGARLTAVGKGETEPAADNASEAGRKQNRRVVLRAGG